ncbi:MAG: hypothetical protein ACFWT6_12050 [Virgibacillus proomii]|jgi:hypothetical protein
MTNKERLEEIKEHFAYCMDEGLLFAEQEEKLLEELYEQSERVQELEKDIEEWKIVNDSWEEINTSLAKQNKRYKQALEEIVQTSITIPDYKEHSLHAEIVAYEALKGESDAFRALEVKQENPNNSWF